MTVIINGTTGITSPEVVLDNSAADGGQVVLKSSGYSNWNWDNYSGRLRAYYNATEYFTIDTSGNVGIGTSSPNKKLAVVSSTDVTTVGSNPVQVLYSGASVNSVAELGFAYGTGTGLTNALATIGYQITSNAGYGASALTFSTRSVTTDTAPSERMRIDSSGNLLVGWTTVPGNWKSSFYTNTSGAWPLSVRGNDRGMVFRLGASSGFATYFETSDGSTAGSISLSGTSTAYNTSSDYRLKENIQPMTGALTTVAQLKPVTYTWKADGSDGQGFIAHELAEVVPDCVTGEKDAVETYTDEDGNEQTRPVYQGIDTSFLVATLTAAIQEQQAIIQTLTDRIEALEAK